MTELDKELIREYASLLPEEKKIIDAYIEKIKEERTGKNEKAKSDIWNN